MLATKHVWHFNFVAQNSHIVQSMQAVAPQCLQAKFFHWGSTHTFSLGVAILFERWLAGFISTPCSHVCRLLCRKLTIALPLLKSRKSRNRLISILRILWTGALCFRTTMRSTILPSLCRSTACWREILTMWWPISLHFTRMFSHLVCAMVPALINCRNWGRWVADL